MRLTSRLTGIWPPRLWVLLLLSNMAVLALPLTGLWAMRLYESALVRQTEAELVAQAAVWAAAFRAELRRTAPGPAPPAGAGLGRTAIDLLSHPGLDLARDPVLPEPPDPVPGPPAEPRAATIGAALAPMVRDAQAVTLSALRITDANGTVVATNVGGEGLNLRGWDEVGRVLDGAPVATAMRARPPVQASLASISRTSRLRVFVVLPVDGGAGIAGAVVLARTPPDAVQAVWNKRWELAGLAGVLLAVGVLMAAGLSRLVTRPLAVVVAQAQRAAAGGSVEPLRHPGTREVAALSAALTRMAVTLDRRARYMIAFAASVSHEFKTPLAGLRGAAELLSDHADTLPAADRARLLAVVSSSTARLDQLVGRLLELARADMARPGAAATRVGPVIEALRPRYRQRGMEVACDCRDETVALPPEALDALLASLLDNAATHASTDGQGAGAAVSVTVRTAGGRTAITVADNGPGISPANRAQVFDAFFTTVRDRGGTGLGLSIVRAIAAGAGGTAELADAATGAAVRIELPERGAAA